MKNLKKLFILIALIIMIFTIYKIIKTYALFESNITGTADMGIGKWNISVNQSDITSGQTHSFTITSFNIPQNQYTKTGKVAPGMGGDFYIEISPVDTQVSIRYDITINKTNLTASNMEITSITELNHDKTLIRTGEDTYTSTILLNQINRRYLDNVQIKFQWENDEDNNERDTEIGTQYNSKIYVPITIKFTQYTGEEIVEYIERRIT